MHLWQVDGQAFDAVVLACSPTEAARLARPIDPGWADTAAALRAASLGSKVQDTIHYSGEQHKFTRGANRAGGLEGGITNGEDVVVRGLLKPISTLRRPLESVDFETRETVAAAAARILELEESSKARLLYFHVLADVDTDEEAFRVLHYGRRALYGVRRCRPS